MLFIRLFVHFNELIIYKYIYEQHFLLAVPDSSLNKGNSYFLNSVNFLNKNVLLVYLTPPYK